jgi:hypothetical protein
MPDVNDALASDGALVTEPPGHGARSVIGRT